MPADGGEAICKSLFFGGVTRRFPQLRFGLLEGGVSWAPPLYSRMIDHWTKRGSEGITHLDPALLQPDVMSTLIDDDTANRKMDGLIGIQLHAGEPMKIEVRKIELRRAP